MHMLEQKSILIQKSVVLLKQKLQQAQVDKSHGFEHALKVMENGKKAIESSTLQISDQKKENILLACLLHDSDDKKYFPYHRNYENAQQILKKAEASQNRIQQILTMISLVSFSKNGDSISSQNPKWWYYPRYADRIQAIGFKNLTRTFQYAKKIDNPIQTPETAKPKTLEQLNNICQGRNQQYIQRGGKSQSVIDHIFDKLLHIRLPVGIQNPYFEQKFEAGKKQLQDFILINARDNYNHVQEQLIKLCSQQAKL